MRRGRKGFIGIFIFLAVFAAATVVVMLLWNWLIPSIIGWSVISFWQAAGLLLLCKLLFGAFGKYGHHGFGHRYPYEGMSFKEKMEMRGRIKNMGREERREYIRNHMFGDCTERKEPTDNNAL